MAVLEAEDPDAAMAALEPAEQALVVAEIEENLVASVEPTSGVPTPVAIGRQASSGARVPVAAARGCWSDSYYMNWTLYGATISSSWMSMSWCYENGRAQNADIKNVGGNGTGVNYEGHTQDKRNVGWEVRGLTTHKWTIGPTGFSKCMQIRGGNNAVSKNISCNLFD